MVKIKSPEHFKINAQVISIVYEIVALFPVGTNAI